MKRNGLEIDLILRYIKAYFTCIKQPWSGDSSLLPKSSMILHWLTRYLLPYSWAVRSYIHHSLSFNSSLVFPHRKPHRIFIFTGSDPSVDSDVAAIRACLNRRIKKEFHCGTHTTWVGLRWIHLEDLIFAVLVISVAIGWLLWQRHINRFEVPYGDESIPSSEK